MKCAVVTGAGTGIGKAAATALLQNGYRVAFAGRRREPLEAAIAEAKAASGQALAIPTNVADPASVAALFSLVLLSTTQKMPAINATRTPPFTGASNCCDVSVSPSTVAVACTLVPGVMPENWARPCASVLTVRLSWPTWPIVSVTSCPATLLPIRSRTTRTVTVRSGNSGAGSGVPAIALGSGIST